MLAIVSGDYVQARQEVELIIAEIIQIKFAVGGLQVAKLEFSGADIPVSTHEYLRSMSLRYFQKAAADATKTGICDLTRSALLASQLNLRRPAL